MLLIFALYQNHNENLSYEFNKCFRVFLVLGYKMIDFV